MMFGETLRSLRKSRAMTQAQLAGKLGISASTVGMYEQGRREPDSEMLKQMADMFGVSVDYLLGDRPASGKVELRELAPQVRQVLLQNEGLMFNGIPLSQEDVEKLVDALLLGAAILSKREEKDR